MTKNFAQMLEEQLQSVDTEADRIARIRQIQDQISQLESQMMELKHQLAQETEGLTGELAVSVRKLMPSLSVSLDSGRCCVRHMSNSLAFKPDFTNSLWDVEPNISGRRFRKYHGHSLGLKHDVRPLADSIGGFFKKRYKRLNMECIGSPVAPTPNVPISPPVRVIPNKAGGIGGWK